MNSRGAAAFGLALGSLVLMCGGVALAVWMSALPPIGTPCGPGCTQYHQDPVEQPWVGVPTVGLGFVVLAVAWRLDRNADARPRQGWKSLRKWGAPLLWLAFIPVVAGPATFLIASSNTLDQSCHVYWTFIGTGGSDCPTSVYLPSVVLPGLLNLVPVWWLRGEGDQRRLIAAVTASLLGVVGFTAALFFLYSMGPTTNWDFGFLLPTLPPQQQADFGVGLVLWLAAIVALLVIAKLPLTEDAAVAPGVTPVLPG